MNENTAVKQNLIDVLGKESLLLDDILSQQVVVHNCVTKRNWLELESTMTKLQKMSDDFVELENQRVALSEKMNIFQDPDFTPVLNTVRNKLNKSKIENHVLNEYISTTKNFLQGIFDEALPQRRNTLYSRFGKIVKPELQSVVLNQVI